MKNPDNITRIYVPLEIYNELKDICFRLENIEDSLHHLDETVNEVRDKQENDHNELNKIVNVRDFFFKFTLPALLAAFSVGLFFSKVIAHLKVMGS